MTEPKAAKQRGRKPANIGHYGTQDAIWQAVRELKRFTRQDVICYVEAKGFAVNDATVNSYLKRLEKGSYLAVEKTPKHRGICQLATYTLERDTGVETPRLTKKGDPVTQGKGRENLWRSMKILREFDWRELALAASTNDHPVAPATAKQYCEILAKAGYLAVLRLGKGRKLSRYRLLDSKNTGPRPPQVQRIKQLYDPNLDKVVWSQQGGAQ